jgi:nucleotide-binding universal stress UspA family protein
MKEHFVPMRTILVGMDGSSGAQRAMAWAVARAQESRAQLIVVHILTYSAELRGDLSPNTWTPWRRKLAATLRHQWAAPASEAGVPVRCELLEDDTPAAGLLMAATRLHADLIVLGAHSHGTLADRLLGATTYKVSHAARAPVVIVPQDWQPVAA